MCHFIKVFIKLYIKKHCLCFKMTTYISKHAKSSFGIILLSGTNFSGKDISSLDNNDNVVLTDLLHETLEQAFRNIRVDDSYIPTDDSKLFQFI